MHQLTRKLDVVWGPDTADLSMHLGLHSGQVTAGEDCRRSAGKGSQIQLLADTPLERRLLVSATESMFPKTGRSI
jgi:hypothetical protein